MGHRRTVRNDMYKAGRSVRGIRATKMVKVTRIKKGKKVTDRVEVRVRNWFGFKVVPTEKMKSEVAKMIREIAKTLRRRYSKSYLAAH